MPSWEKLCPLSELPPGTRRVFPHGTGGLLVVNIDGKLFAASNECPHLGVSLEKGELQGQVLRCSEHGYKMDLGTGACLTEAGLKLPVYPVEVRDGWIGVEIRP